ncbi:MAG: formylmethanofuran dehydrogenase subunit C [Acidobacteria bacterium]|nr:formylmethanofuran dehydrogenase subunit C [Acidobacteriota bacterium]
MQAETSIGDSMIISGENPAISEGTDPVRLRLKEEPKLPLEAEALSPDVIGSLPRKGIQELPVFMGKHSYRLSDFFDVEGERSVHLDLHGDLAKVKLIGRGMTHGSIVIHGNAGMHLGAAMSGGSIIVHGNATDWLGAEMSGGLIHIHGNAGGQVGAAYRGSRKGMRGGVILIDGSAGIEIAMRMRRGLMCIQGRVGDFAGIQMLGGTLVLCSTAGLRTGAWMSRGTIITLEPIKLLPTFIYACTYEPAFLRLVFKQLGDLHMPGMDSFREGRVQRYIGDTSGLGKGEILICEPRG